MPFRPKNLVVNLNNPTGAAACDRCKFVWNTTALAPQYEWAGTALVNTNLRVCPTCMDVPNESLRTPILPPDPLPQNNPRPFNFDVE